MKLERHDRKLIAKLRDGKRLTRSQMAHLARLSHRIKAANEHKSNPAPAGSGLPFNGTVGNNGGM